MKFNFFYCYINRVTYDSMLLSCHAFQNESTIYSCLNVKELVDQIRRHIWHLSNNNRIRTHNHLVHKQTLNHLAKLTSLAKWLSVHLRTKWLWVRIRLGSLIFSTFSAVYWFPWNFRLSETTDGLKLLKIFLFHFYTIYLHNSFASSRLLKTFLLKNSSEFFQKEIFS